MARFDIFKYSLYIYLYFLVQAIYGYYSDYSILMYISIFGTGVFVYYHIKYLLNVITSSGPIGHLSKGPRSFGRNKEQYRNEDQNV